jgi:hypothetical protein
MDGVEDGSTPFHLFAKNTRQTCLLMCISLFLIILLSVFKSNSGWTKLLLVAAASLLAYCFYTNVKETGILYHSAKNDTDVKNNIVLSYVFSSVLFIFLVYILYTMLF